MSQEVTVFVDLIDVRVPVSQQSAVQVAETAVLDDDEEIPCRYVSTLIRSQIKNKTTPNLWRCRCRPPTG